MITHSETEARNAVSHSAVSWAAILAGAAGAAALSLILLLLGAGFGFAVVSPWEGRGMSAEGLGVTPIIWLAVTQIVAAGLGGYLAGRLRVRWADLHGDEVYFRDTAHGFLSWAVATLVTAMLVLGSVSGLVGTGAQAGAQAASAATASMKGSDASGSTDPNAYFVDALFRDDRPAPVADDAAHGVVSRIIARTLANGGQLSPEDRAYLAQLVSQRTDLSRAQAEQRVDQVYGQARASAEQAKLAAQKAADAASTAAAWASLWMFVALLIGAFFASWAATFGGKRRDEVGYLGHGEVRHGLHSNTIG